MYTIYTKNLCNYCTLAKKLLEEKGYEYKEINITHDDIAKSFLKNNGYKTVPQIFYNGTEYIGDYTMFKERLNKQ
tara:strand:+ start:336 stop:560 length:225 start_codon:yes stop_codon:yes gene_type:complete